MVEKKKTLSKFALSNIFRFFELKEALSLRLVSAKFDAAVMIGLTIEESYELNITIDMYRYLINRDFSSEN
jgi:hypothetical protein